MRLSATSSEARRLRMIASIDLDDPHLRQELNAITERTARRLNQPVSLVSMVLDTAQFFAGSHGLEGWLADVHGTPVEWSFCATAVETGQPYVVPDSTADARQSTNPLVAVDGLRSYAGVPIVVDGTALGAHCVIGFATHTFTDAELQELRVGANEIAAILGTYQTP